MLCHKPTLAIQAFKDRTIFGSDIYISNFEELCNLCDFCATFSTKKEANPGTILLQLVTCFEQRCNANATTNQQIMHIRHLLFDGETIAQRIYNI